MYYKNLKLEDLTEVVDGVLCTEKWVDIDMWEGRYMVSDFGRIKSLKRIGVRKNGVQFKIRERILSQSFDKDKYLLVVFGENNFKHTNKVHRLVGKAFLPNPENKPEINHKSGIKSDNRRIDLEWATPAENTNHAFRELGVQSGRKGKVGVLHKKSKPVYCCTLDCLFESANQAQIKLGITGIGEVCNGNLFSTHGMIFRYI